MFPFDNPQYDQMAAGLRDMAATVAIYYAELKKQKFTDSQALQLTMNWQTAVIQANMKRPE